MTAYGPALRIARRDALRAKGRTALVLCMIGLPVAAIVGLGVVWKTMDWSPRESLPYEIGAADARISGASHGRVLRQDPLTGEALMQEDPDGDRPWTTEEITRRVTVGHGPDARVLPMSRGTPITLRTSRGDLRADLTELDVRDPLARGILEITDGRAPAAPDEIALAAASAERGELPVGATVRAGREGTAKRVVGYVRDPRSPADPVVLALPGAFADAPAAPRSRHWLIAVDEPVTWDDVAAFNRDGITVLSRRVASHPPPEAVVGGGLDRPRAEIAAMAAALLLLEAVLLAGPAFAVGIRRQRRLLALVSAAGGEPRQLRAVVLAGGLVLGGAAASAGALAGITAAAVTAAVARATAAAEWGPFEVPWAAAAATVLLGTVSGLAAAYVPARQAARTNAVAVLAGRRAPARAPSRRGGPISGAVLVAAGVLCCLLGVGTLRGFGAAAGAAAIVIGTVLAVPWLVGATGRVAGRLPVPLRLAVRDGARNRARTAPAVAAIMAAAAAATALAIVDAGDLERARAAFRPQLPMGSAIIRPPLTRTDENRAARVRAAIERELPGLPLLDLHALPGNSCDRVIDPDCRHVAFGHGHDRSNPSTHPDNAVGDGPSWARTLFGRNEPVEGSDVYPDIVVGGAAEARMVLGRDDPEVVAALRAGKLVLFDGGPVIHGGTVTATVQEWERGAPKPVTIRQVRGVPAVRVSAETHPWAIMPPSLAERIGMPPRLVAFGVDRAEHRVGETEAMRLAEMLDDIDGDDPGQVYAELGPRRSGESRVPLLAAMAAVLALGGALIATGLSAADARPDLAVLAAVGARPRTRRLLAAGQAAYIAVLGCWLGIAAGFIPGVAASRLLAYGPGYYGRPGSFVDVPWPELLAAGIAVPLLTAVVAGLCTRSKLPGTRVAAR
ncbi:hypothetical protein GCM10010182_19340 [Actinomadura cremea]|nr:hypothetical protein GCM10010182_19340 [Actinomadura cremea]